MKICLNLDLVLDRVGNILAFCIHLYSLHGTLCSVIFFNEKYINVLYCILVRSILKYVSILWNSVQIGFEKKKRLRCFYGISRTKENLCIIMVL